MKFKELLGSISPEAEKDFQILNDYLVTLKTIEADTPPHPAVTIALTELHRLLAPHKDFLIQNNVLVGVHGSLQYHDPKNLDADLDLITFNNPISDQIFQWMLFDFSKEIEASQIWPVMGPNAKVYANGFAQDLEEHLVTLQEYLPKLIDVNQDYSLEEMDNLLEQFNMDGIFPQLGFSNILSNKLLFPNEQADLYQQAQIRVLHILLENKFLRKAAIHDLHGVIETRRKRRETN